MQLLSICKNISKRISKKTAKKTRTIHTVLFPDYFFNTFAIDKFANEVRNASELVFCSTPEQLLTIHPGLGKELKAAQKLDREVVKKLRKINL